MQKSNSVTSQKQEKRSVQNPKKRMVLKNGLKMSTSLTCAGCNKEAYRRNGTTVPLKRCSRCKQVYYHDRTCQEKHYREHRAVCLPVSNPSAVEGERTDQVLPAKTPRNAGDTWSEDIQSVCSVKNIHGKGNFLVAVNSLESGSCIPNKKDEGIPPLVHPVLLRSCRRTHCAWCFGDLSERTKQCLMDNSIVSYFVCSSTCRERISTTLRNEIQALKYLYPSTGQSLGPPMLLPTALLVFRMLQALKQGMVREAALEAMATHRVPLFENAKVHEEAIVMTVSILLHASSISNVEDDTIVRYLGYAKYNLFTITHGGNSVGVGLFQSPAHFINHSCRPNALQLFELRTGTAPRLRLVMTRAVKAGDEICISYNSEIEKASCADRRKELYRDYNFWCDCEMCREAK